MKCQVDSRPKFIAGNISNCYNIWENITQDKNILQIVKGCKIDLESNPYQICKPTPINFSEEEKIIIDNEIDIMLDKKVIVETQHELGEFMSNISLRPKKDGRFRVILNLKKFNNFVRYKHFKLDCVMTCINMMKENCYMASIDLRDAYYSVPVCSRDQKYLKFEWNGKRNDKRDPG